MKQYMVSVGLVALAIAGACTTNDDQADPIDRATSYAASCDAAQGPVESFATDSELTQLLGRISCSSTTVRVVPTRSTASTSKGPGTLLKASWCSDDPNVSESGGVTLESGPRKLDAQFGYSGMDSIYASAQ
ncbi:MAG TPA: hypothetical protein VGL61_34665 [Kofleriaceae bacterium]|jgi:hypothetical protein